MARERNAALEWRDVDLPGRELCLRPEISKNKDGRPLPLRGDLLEIIGRAHQVRDLRCSSERFAGRHKRAGVFELRVEPVGSVPPRKFQDNIPNPIQIRAPNQIGADRLLASFDQLLQAGIFAQNTLDFRTLQTVRLNGAAYNTLDEAG
ncbi:MAG: hypothetical protein ACREQ4_14090 [Candidatus Binataceae bacterium]